MTTKVDGGELVARTLRAFGVDCAFGLHGGHLDSLLIGLQRNGIRLLDTRHEAVSVDAADGYARATGRLGVAFVTAASGYSNALAGIAVAYADRSPVLILTSSPPLRDAEMNALQGTVDQVAMAAPITKWAHRVTVVEEIPRLVSLAVRKAMSGAPGPVVLDLPIDILFAPADESKVAWGGGAKLAAPPAPAPSATLEALALLSAAKRPVIIAGAGARHAGGLLVEFAERSGIPVFCQLHALGSIPADHSLNGFGVGNLGLLSVLGLERPDAVLLLGVRPGLLLAGRSGAIVPDDAKVVHVDVDSSEIGRILPVDVGLTSDCGEALAAFLAADDVQWPDRRSWWESVTSVHRRESPYVDAESVVSGRLHPYHAARELLRSVGPDVTIVVDGGEVQAWVADVLHEAKPHSAVGFNGYLGFLGTGAGLAIGTQVAEPSRRVVLIVGDGAWGFHLQEIDTMVRHQLPIVTIVFNNTVWGMSIHGQHAVYGPEGEVVSRLADSDYDRVAAGFGAHAERVSKLDDVAPAVRRALDTGGPALINLDVSGEVVHPITPTMVGFTDDPNVIVIPYYDNVVRPTS